MVLFSRYGQAALLAVGIMVCANFAVKGAWANADTPVHTARQNLSAPIPPAPVQFIKADPKDFTLTDKDARLYRRLFTHYVRGEHKQARNVAGQITDKSLQIWAGIGGHPPAVVLQGAYEGQREYISPKTRDKAQEQIVQTTQDRVVAHIRAGRMDWAEDTLDNAMKQAVLDRVELAQIRATIAGAYLYNNQPGLALRHAHFALQVGGRKVPQAAWIAGLASFKKDKYGLAAQYFAWVPRSDYAGPWMRSGAAYWTARSLAKEGHYAQVSAWLMEAAKHPRSFYGLIATRMLGSRFDFEWDVPEFNIRHAKILKKHPSAVRALKLAQAGQMDMAQAELTLIDAQSHSALRQALAALASTALAPDAAMHIAGMLQTPLGGTMDVALYPLSPWHPTDGYRVDPALLHAFVRQESRFKMGAQNKGSGATGLMQLMPRTAKSLSGKTLRSGDLKKPETSLALGQKYLEDLLDMTQGDLFDAAIAYNAGPTRLREWKVRFEDVSDPLLFIELIPYAETRAYVERVMANYWIYSLRMGQDAVSLDDVAGGRTAIYTHPSHEGENLLAFK